MAEVRAQSRSPVAAARCVEAIQAGRIGVSYEALVDLHSLEPVGYEALARFYDASGELIDNGSMFGVLHENPALFYSVELDLKARQIAHAPDDVLLFVNLDPHAYFVFDASGHEQAAVEHPMHALFARRSGQLVVELTENSSLSDAQLSLRLARKLIECGHRVAIDDIGHPRSLLSIDLLNSVQYFKFHCDYLQQLDCERARDLTAALLDYARLQSVPAIIEGIESAAQLEQARSLGYDLAQGYFFSERTRNVMP